MSNSPIESEHYSPDSSILQVQTHQTENPLYSAPESEGTRAAENRHETGLCSGAANRTPPTSHFENKFVRLRDEWKAKRGPESSTTKLVMHPAYQTIIGMGPDAVPLLLRELQTNPDSWFWALRAITEADPVPLDVRGDVLAMARAWLDWGKNQGYQW